LLLSDLDEGLGYYTSAGKGPKRLEAEGERTGLTAFLELRLAFLDRVQVILLTFHRLFDLEHQREAEVQGLGGMSRSDAGKPRQSVPINHSSESSGERIVF
jgi:hypothetical protein